MSDTQTNRVYRMIDSLTDTISWAELAKELGEYADKETDASSVSGGETIEVKDLVKQLLEKNPPSSEGN